jgi:NTE family protein
MSVGLVLGGGGVTGAAYEMAALMAIELATGWNPNHADVVVGTSAGSYVAALVRSERLVLDSLVLAGETREEVAARIASRLFVKRPGVHVRRWVRHGILPGVLRPGLTLLLGSPAPFHAGGLADWVREQIGPDAEEWPTRPTVVVAFDVAARRRVAFGTVEAPDLPLAEAVAASSAIPLIFRPYEVEGRVYVDGGIASGTHADLVLGANEPLDLVIVLAPMAAEEARQGAWLHERVFDRVGCRSLEEEVALIRSTWPHADVLVMRPSPAVLAAMRPNPMDAKAAVPTFIRTLTAMKRTLARPEVWSVLSRHLVNASSRPGRPAPA